MDLQEYLDRATATDNFDDQEHAIQVALFGIAGEAGELVSEAKKGLGIPEAMMENIHSRHYPFVASQIVASLAAIASE